MPLLLLIGLFGLAHGILFLHDLYRPEAFLRADRGPARLEKILFVLDPERLIAPEELPTHDAYSWLFPDRFRDLSTLERVAALGTPGDYLPQGLLWMLGGPRLIILCQVALAFVATVAVMGLGRLLGLGAWAAAGGAALYALLPASLCQPHQLISEALFNPLVVLAIFLIVGHLEQKFGKLALLTGLLLLSAALMVRSQLLPIPVLLAGVVIVRNGRAAASKASFVLLISFLLPVAWYLLILAATGAPPGESNVTLGRNLALMARRASRVAGETIIINDTMKFGDFLIHGLGHPFELIRLKAADAVNLILNPGTNILFGDYLGFSLFDFGREGERIWVQARSKGGLVDVLAIMLQQDPWWLTIFVSTMALWGVFLIVGILGLVHLFQCSVPGSGTKLLLGGYLLFTFLVVQLAATRLGHRSSLEFLLALGATAWLTRPVSRRT